MIEAKEKEKEEKKSVQLTAVTVRKMYGLVYSQYPKRWREGRLESLLSTRELLRDLVFSLCACVFFFFFFFNLVLLAFSRFSLKIPDLHRYSCSIAGMMGETPLMACVGR